MKEINKDSILGEILYDMGLIGTSTSKTNALSYFLVYAFLSISLLTSIFSSGGSFLKAIGNYYFICSLYTGIRYFFARSLVWASGGCLFSMLRALIVPVAGPILFPIAFIRSAEILFKKKSA